MVKGGKVRNLKIGNMKNISNKNKLKCLFGHHNYAIPNKNNPRILICDVCKRFGYCKYYDGYEVWYEYDKKGNRIHFKNSDEYEEWWEYDERGNMIHWKDSSGYEVWYEHDEKGNMIYRKDSDGFEEWYDGEKWNITRFEKIL